VSEPRRPHARDRQTGSHLPAQVGLRHDEWVNDDTPAGGFGGGNLSAAVRVGDTVQRDAGPWTPTIHRLLGHLHDRGIRWVPRPLGTIGPSQAREVVSLLPGTVPKYPMPPWVWDDAILVDAAAHLAAVHRASRDFDTADSCWRIAAHVPTEVICHNDFAPYNLVFDAQHAIVGVIDWDTASPGPRIWDLAYLAYRLVPLAAPGNPDAPAAGNLDEKRRRLALLCRSYGDDDIHPGGVAASAVQRLHELADFTADRARSGTQHLREHVQRYEHDAAWLAASLPVLQ
jgi:hypothetical protein